MHRLWLWLLFLPVLLHAQSKEEVDFQHPSILRFANQRISRNRFSRKDLAFQNDDWEKTKVAIVRFLATLEFYPSDYEFFFLARDAEPIHDLALLLFQDTPQMIRRIHLLQVSRASKNEPELWAYLGQSGINPAQAALGKKFLLIDTGTRGSIPDFIRERADAALKGRIQAHFLLSGNRAYPSSRAFLSYLEADPLTFDVTRHESRILLFENLPHYTYPAVRYQKVGSRWATVTGPTFEAPSNSFDLMNFGVGQGILPESSYFDRGGAEALQFDLYQFSQRNGARTEFASARKIWRNLRSVFERSERENNPMLFKKALAGLLKRSPKRDFEAIARDAFEIANKNFVRKPAPLLRWKEIAALTNCEDGLR